jgi:hypothetical protein
MDTGRSYSFHSDFAEPPAYASRLDFNDIPGSSKNALAETIRCKTPM